jgi:hypothetical protein
MPKTHLRKNYPLCHHPRLNEKAEMDITPGDWVKIDKIVVENLVTSQAQKRLYTKVISSGD